MDEYRVLLIDDEPAVVENIALLLEGIPGLSIDMYRAYNAQSALSLLEEGRMDLVLSDIEMPGLNGIELLDIIHRRWPHCLVAFLTAHSKFNYAYQAIQKQAADYILKTEDEDVIVQRVVKLLNSLKNRMRLEPGSLDTAPFNSESDSLIRQILTLRDPTALRDMLKHVGFDLQTHSYYLLLARIGEDSAHVSDSVLHSLVLHHMEGSTFFAAQPVRLPEEELLVWLVQSREADSQNSLPILFGLLETIQASCLETLGCSFSVILEPFSFPGTVPSLALRSAMKQAQGILSQSRDVLFSHAAAQPQRMPDLLGSDVARLTVEWVKKYIDENVSGDITLMNLSSLTGYNAHYLSGIFHEYTGSTLSRYISSKRLQAAVELLSQSDITIEDITRRLHFGSRSYFNRFIKQETGYTPLQLRRKKLDDHHIQENDLQ